MKKNLLIKISTSILATSLLIATPLALVSCSSTPTLSERDLYKQKINGHGLNITQEAIDILGEDLYRNENGLNVLDVSHWSIGGKELALNQFNKPVDKIIIDEPNVGIEEKSFYLRHAFFFPANKVIGEKIEDIYRDFSLKGTLVLSAAIMNVYGYRLNISDIVTEENILQLGAFPIHAFENITKLEFNSTGYADGLRYEYASFPYAFRNAQFNQNDSNLVAYDGYNYPGIIADKNYIVQLMSSIIPFSEGDKQFIIFDKDKWRYVVPQIWPGFGGGFYFAPSDNPELKIFIRDLYDVNAFLSIGRRFEDYLNNRPEDIHVKKNYATAMKIYGEYIQGGINTIEIRDSIYSGGQKLR